MPEIVITKDEKENALLKMVDDRIVSSLQDPKVIEAVRKATGKDPVDPRNKSNFQRWNNSLGAFPVNIKEATGINHHKARAKAAVSAFLGEEGSPQRAIHENFAEVAKLKSQESIKGVEFHIEPALVKAGLLGEYVKGKGFISKAAEVASVNDLRTVAGTEYDPEIHAFPTRKIHFEDLMPSKPCDKGAVDYLQEFGYSGFTGYGLIAGNNVGAVLEVDDPTSPLSLTDSTVNVNMVVAKVANLRTKISVASELMDDIPGLQEFLEMRVETMGAYTSDAELAAGSGTAPHMLGFYTDPLCQTFNWSAGIAGDTQADAVLHGIILAWLAEHEPDAIPMSPSDWGAIIALKNAINSYLIPSAHTKDNAKTLWGLDVTPTTGNPQGYAMPGSWSTSALLRDRQKSSLVWTRDYGTDRDSNIIRCFYNRRLAVQKFRPEGFVAVHFDAPPAG